MNNRELSGLCMEHLLKRNETSILVLEELYIDFFNDFLTIAHAAECMGVSEDLFAYAIDLGRTFNHNTRPQKEY